MVVVRDSPATTAHRTRTAPRADGQRLSPPIGFTGLTVTQLRRSRPARRKPTARLPRRSNRDNAEAQGLELARAFAFLGPRICSILRCLRGALAAGNYARETSVVRDKIAASRSLIGATSSPPGARPTSGSRNSISWS